MFALREFRYGDKETGRTVVVKQGQEVNAEVLAKHNCDIGKLERTKFVAQAETPSTGYKGRKRKK